MMSIWKYPYVLRRFEKPVYVNGHKVASHYDMNIQLDVQVDGGQTTNLSEGKRQRRDLRGYGDILIRTENVQEGIKADRLFFQGEWYECTSCVLYEHTPIAHYNSRFTRISEATVDNKPSTQIESMVSDNVKPIKKTRKKPKEVPKN